MPQLILTDDYRQVLRAGNTFDNYMRLRQGYVNETPNYVSIDPGSAYFTSLWGNIQTNFAVLSGMVIDRVRLVLTTDAYGASNQVAFHIYKAPFSWNPNDGSKLNPSDYYPARRLKDLVPFETPVFSRNQTQEVDIPLDYLDHLRSGMLLAIWRRASTNRPDGAIHARALSADAPIQLIVDYHAPVSEFTLNKTTLNAGEAITATIDRASSGYTHKVTWRFGTAEKVYTGVATGNTFTVPMDWLTQIPNALSGTATCVVETFDGSKSMGARAKDFTITVPASVVPTISSFDAIRVDGTVPSSWGVYVKNKSKVRLVTTAEGAHGSTIKTYALSGGGISSPSSNYTTPFISTSGKIKYTVKVTDSRGRTATATIEITVVDYNNPSISNVRPTRCLADGTANTSGTYIKLTCSIGFSSVSGKNTIAARAYYKRSTNSAWLPTSGALIEGGQLIFGDNAIDPRYTYDVKVVATDAFVSVEYRDNVSTAKKLFSFGKNRIAFGKMAEIEGAVEFDPELDIYYKADHIERLWSNPEILLNSDFRVWQFGTSGFAAPNVYTADMWIAKANGSGYVFNISRRSSSGGIVIDNKTTSAATMSLRQYMEDTSIIGKTVTLTVDADGFSSDPVTFVFQAAEAEILSDGNGNRVFTSGAGAYPYIAFHIDIGQTLRINSIHLEYGPVGTRYTPRHMAEELMLCQRYRQQIVLLNDAPWLYEGSTIRRYVYRWNPMRIAPTVDLSGATEMRIWAATGATSYLANNVKTDGCFVVATSPAPATANNCYLTGTIRLDANIY